MNVSLIVAIVNLVIGIFIVILSAISAYRLRGGTLAWLPTIFLSASILYVVHAGIEVFGLGSHLYAYSAFIATFLLGLCLFVIDRTIRLMGV